MLLHDTMLRDDSHGTGTADTPVCECGLERETAEHFLLHCPRFHEARNKLTDTLKEIYIPGTYQVRPHLIPGNRNR